jgi:hypothetical protein
LSAKKNLREELTKWQYRANQCDRERQEAVALLATVLVKFGGSLTLTKADAEPITQQFGIAKTVDSISGAVTLKVRVHINT